MSVATSIPFISLICRLHLGELPYIKSYVEHYYKLGVTDILFMVRPKHYGFRVLSSYIGGLSYPGLTIRTYKYSHPYGGVLANIKSEYIVHFDCDEYLDLRDMSLKDYIINTGQKPYYTFHWQMSTFKHNGYAFDNTQHKSICRRDIATAMNDHDFVVKSSVEKFASDIPLIHYWGRTFNDIIFKVIYGDKLQASRAGSVTQIVSGQLPNRFKMLALLDRCSDIGHSFEVPCYVKVDTELEQECLRLSKELLGHAVTGEQLEIIKTLYEKYPVPESVCQSYLAGEYYLTPALLLMQQAESLCLA